MAFVPESFLRARDLEKVRRLCARLAHPHWMLRPRSWMWARPDGMPQGFGNAVYTNPGLSNLLWLSMDMDAPPTAYDAQMNSLYVVLFQGAEFARIGGTPLTDLAALCTLREFVDRLPREPGRHGAEVAYPLLRLLAERRLKHADT
jgi:hypothetical protein